MSILQPRLLGITALTLVLCDAVCGVQVVTSLLPATLGLHKLAVTSQINQSFYCLLVVQLCRPHQRCSAVPVSLVDVKVHSALNHPTHDVMHWRKIFKVHI